MSDHLTGEKSVFQSPQYLSENTSHYKWERCEIAPDEKYDEHALQEELHRYEVSECHQFTQ